MTPVIVKYPLDPTGVSPDNLVANEPHSLPNRSVRAIAPIYGAFFSASLVVKDKQNNRTLVNNLQYYAAELYAVPTAEFGKEVCAIILITDPNVSNNIEITYQAVGGQYSVSTQAIVSLLDSLNLDNRPVAWPNIINRPSQFPPAPHLHDIGDTYGWEDVVFAIDRLNAAIQLGDEIQHDEFYRYVDSKLAAFAPPNLPAIRTPFNLTPTNGETDVSAMPVFTFTPYYSLYGIPGDRVVAQIDTDPNFTHPKNSFTESYGVYNSYQPNIPLDSLVTYYWRVAYIDIEGTQSEWSLPTSFTTLAVGIVTPTIINPVDGAVNVNDGITIMSSPFAFIGPDDVHQASSWEIWDDPNFSLNRVFFLEGSYTDLTSVTIPLGTFEVNKDYYVRVRYYSLNYGYSLFSPLSKFTTAASFTFEGVPYGTPLGGGYYGGDLSIIRNTFELNSRLPLAGPADLANMDRYAVILAPKESGEFKNRALAPTHNTFFNTLADYDGLDNTAAIAANFNTFTNGAARAVDSLSVNGFADWQIPTDVVLNIVLNNLNRGVSNLPLSFQLNGSQVLDSGTYWSSNTNTVTIPPGTVVRGPDTPVLGPVVDTYNQSGATAVCPSPYVVGNDRVVTDAVAVRTWNCTRQVQTQTGTTRGPIIGYDQVQGPPIPVYGQIGVNANPHASVTRISPGDCSDTPGSTGVTNVVYTNIGGSYPLISWDCPVPIIGIIRYDPGAIDIVPIYGPDVPVYTTTTETVPMTGTADVPASCPIGYTVANNTVLPLGSHHEWTCTATVQGVIGYTPGPDVTTTTVTNNYRANVRSITGANSNIITGSLQDADIASFTTRAVRLIPLQPLAPPVDGGNNPVTVSFTANGNWTAPAGVTFVSITGRGASSNGASIGASSTAINNVFPGAQVGGFASNTTVNNVTVVPGTVYPIVVSGAGIINITYTVGAIAPVPPVDPNGYFAITRYSGGQDGTNTYRKITINGVIINRNYEDTLTAIGTYGWICPAGVTSISAVCVGQGSPGTTGNGGGGGAISYINNIAVTPGTAYRVSISATATEFTVGTANALAGAGIGGIGGSPGGTGTGFRGGNGGTGFADQRYADAGGGGAAGYLGDGGVGADATSLTPDTGKAAIPNSGGGSGGGPEYPGGSVGLYGVTTTGGVTTGVANPGSDGEVFNIARPRNAYYARYGGGGSNNGLNAAPGARVVWSRPNGPQRLFPSTEVGIASSGSLEDALIITKNLTSPASSWVWQDTIRGQSNQNPGLFSLFSDRTDPNSESASGVIHPVQHDGYYIPNAVGGLTTNEIGNEYVSYTFRKATRFFDIVTYTGNSNGGRSIPHSLGVAPGLIIFKNLSGVSNWVVYMLPLGGSYRGQLNSTAIPVGDVAVFNNTQPTATDFTVGTSASGINNVNQINSNYIAYLFAHDDTANSQVKVGLYTGTGSARSETYFTNFGFQPRFLMIKNIDTAGNWFIVDTARGLTTSNSGAGTGNELYLDSNNGEGVAGRLAYLTTNGFIPVSLANTNGQRYVYLAIK